MNPCPDPILVDASLLNLGRPFADGLFFPNYTVAIVRLGIASVASQSALTARIGGHTVTQKLGLNGWGITVRRGSHPVDPLSLVVGTPGRQTSPGRGSPDTYPSRHVDRWRSHDPSLRPDCGPAACPCPAGGGACAEKRNTSNPLDPRMLKEILQHWGWSAHPP